MKTSKTRILSQEYYHSMRSKIVTSRFNTKTIDENANYRSKNPQIGSIYCSPQTMTEKIPVDSNVFVLEMNNDTNQIIAIGMVKNHPFVQKYHVYENGNYNRYVYVGKYRISRTEMTEQENQIMTALDILCFTGNRHMKRGQGLTRFPPDMLFGCSHIVDIPVFIAEMFKSRFQDNKNNAKSTTIPNTITSNITNKDVATTTNAN